mgnify:FL=1|nr:MAG TPA: hypothetical protein [Caudoviricetes sp.]
MTWEELEKRIDNFYLDNEDKIKIPYSHYDFDREVEPPHLMSTEIDSDNFIADNIIYFEKSNTRLELTTDTRDRSLEKRVEKEILYDIVWKKQVAYIQSERIWNVSYFFEI